MASLGCPIVGDKLYITKSKRREKNPLARRQMLHAFRLKFTLFSKKYAFEAPLPEDFRATLQAIDGVDETPKTVYDGEALKSLELE